MRLNSTTFFKFQTASTRTRIIPSYFKIRSFKWSWWPATTRIITTWLILWHKNL